jgi:hypothetical protein
LVADELPAVPAGLAASPGGGAWHHVCRPRCQRRPRPAQDRHRPDSASCIRASSTSTSPCRSARPSNAPPRWPTASIRSCASSRKSTAPPSPSASRKASNTAIDGGEHTARLTVRLVAGSSGGDRKSSSSSASAGSSPTSPTSSWRSATRRSSASRARSRSKSAATTSPRSNARFARRSRCLAPRCPIWSTSAPVSRPATRRFRSSTTATGSPSSASTCAPWPRSGPQQGPGPHRDGQFRQEDQLIDIVVRLREQDRVRPRGAQAPRRQPQRRGSDPALGRRRSHRDRGPESKSAASTSNVVPSSPATSAAAASRPSPTTSSTPSRPWSFRPGFRTRSPARTRR